MQRLWFPSGMLFMWIVAIVLFFLVVGASNGQEACPEGRRVSDIVQVTDDMKLPLVVLEKDSLNVFLLEFDRMFNTQSPEMDALYVVIPSDDADGIALLFAVRENCVYGQASIPAAIFTSIYGKTRANEGSDGRES